MDSKTLQAQKPQPKGDQDQLNPQLHPMTAEKQSIAIGGVAHQPGEDLAKPPPRANHPHAQVEAQNPRVATNLDIPGMANSAIPSRQPVQGGPPTVQVRLVWPANRGAKIDCQAHTGTVWTGNGDVQSFPAEKWWKLAPHPDVWELVDQSDIKVAQQAAVDRVETPEERIVRLHLEDDAAKRDRVAQNAQKAAAAAREAAASTNTDMVIVGTSLGRPATEHAPTFAVPERPSSQLAPNTYDAAALAPHTETAALEAKAKAEATAANDVVEPKANLPRPETKVDEFDLAPAADLNADPPIRAVRVQKLERAALDGMSDEEVHSEGLRRDFVLHQRLNANNLRMRFLELQAQAAKNR